MQSQEGSDSRKRARTTEESEESVQVCKVCKRAPRTTEDAPVPAPEALEALVAGNQRYCEGVCPLVAPLGAKGREALVDKGQRPSAIVLGCADSRAPPELVFDAQPGDLFILRTAGNAVAKAECAFVGSMEYAVAHLQSKLILVLGHTKCGAVAGATKVALEKRKAPVQPAKKDASSLEVLLDSLAPVAEETAAQLPPDADEATIAAATIKTNVFNSMASILEHSSLIRERVASGDVEVHGGIYDLCTGKVEFLGQHPKHINEQRAMGA